MARPFVDYLINDLGTPRHWWAMTSNTADFYEQDIGTAASVRFHFGPSTSEPPNDFDYRQASMTVDDASWSIQYNGGPALNQTGAGLPNTVINNELFADDSKGSVFMFFKGTGTLSENYLWSTHPSDAAFNIYTTTDGKVLFQVIAGTSARGLLSPSGGLNDGAAHLLVLTQAGSGTRTKMYIDGYEVTPTILDSGPSPPVAGWWKNMRDNATSGVWIRLFSSERYALTAFDRPWIGKMEHVGVFDAILTAPQVEQMWLRSKAMPILRARYPRRRSK